MLGSIKRSVSGLVAQMQRLNTLGNNIANATTPGYKKTEGSFGEVLLHSMDQTSVPVVPTDKDKLTHGVEYRPETMFTQGGLNPTGRPLDMALEGPGFLELMSPDGRPVYSRGGAFSIDSRGQLVHSSGSTVVGVTINPQASIIEIGADGAITIDVNGEIQQAGKLRLVSFVNPSGLERMGDNLYAPSVNSGLMQPAESTTAVRQGFLETSNVELVEEMTALIRAQRAYQANARALKTLDEMWEKSNTIRR